MNNEMAYLHPTIVKSATASFFQSNKCVFKETPTGYNNTSTHT